MKFEKVDRIPIMTFEPFEGYTVDLWRNSGCLPDNKSVEECLGIDNALQVPLNLYPIPAYKKEIIAEDKESFTEIDFLGTTVKRKKEAPNMYYGCIDFPVKSTKDWEEYKKRFDSGSKQRYLNFTSTLIQKFSNSDKPLWLNIYPFFFRLCFYTLGMERFMFFLHDEPDLIHDMFSFWSEFAMDVIEPILSNTKIDYVTFNEDLAYKCGPHISPEMYNEFWIPYMTPVIGKLKNAGISTIALWTAGNIEVLIPTLINNGINCILPLERNADMDPVVLRKKYGRDLCMFGGISKESCIKSTDAIDRELDYLMPVIEEGGFIPSLDDMPPPELPFKNFEYLINKLKSI